MNLSAQNCNGPHAIFMPNVQNNHENIGFLYPPND
jgi:hypothetical protein